MTVVTLETPLGFDATLMAIALVLAFGVLGLIAFFAFVRWLMQPRDYPLGDKRKTFPRPNVTPLPHKERGTRP